MKLLRSLLVLLLLASITPAQIKSRQRVGKPLPAKIEALDATEYVTFIDALSAGLNDGERIIRLRDLSKHGRDAVQFDPAHQPVYRASEEQTEHSSPYIAAAELDDYLTIPLTPSETRAFFVVVRHQPSVEANAYTLYLDDQNWLSTISPNGTGRWLSYKVYGGQGTRALGYSAEYSVLCWRMNADGTMSLFVDGELAETYRPNSPTLAAATSIRLGRGFGRVKQLGVMDKGRELTGAEVADQTNRLLRHNKLTWRYEFLGRSGVDYAPTLNSEGIIVSKRGISGARPLVILNHQAGASERVFLDTPEQRAVLAALVNAGYIVAASRQWDAVAGVNSWGNRSAVEANVELYRYAVEHYNVDTSNVAMVGFSMGGLSSMTAFGDGRIPVRGAACFDCVLNLSYTYQVQTSGIAQAYGIQSAAEFLSKTAGYDPLSLGGQPFAGKSFIFFSNANDMIINPWENTSRFAAQISGVGNVRTVNYAGGHLENISPSVPALMEFLEQVFS